MTLTTQFVTMLAMIGMGSVFGAALDTYNRFLQRTRRKSWLVFINDILFWLVQGLAIFYILFLVNQGELRFYIFIALLCGFAAYQSLFKKMYLRVLEISIRMAISIYRFFVKTITLLIYKPIQGLIMALIAIAVMLGKGLYSLLKVILRVFWFILKVVFLPVKWILSLLWKLLPKKIKKTVEKLYNKLAGYLQLIKNYVLKWIAKWKKPKE
ncbi:MULTISPECIES: spore cortex biosynthesis protein YabQ [Cytobacillus]|jgi:spore cortex biosynthesis protein YabQ|uniref:Spore cortex biosynthesis protein YabQ n=2 Tax=Cytobacillus TaxID=2675230 RepID=A0ABX3CTA1_9BACI|nr:MULTISPECIES: spore cortex biosynthesis protein YabQ [Cytobacillus]MBY0159421.1 spore cortex biosynthesis protein YabQ [Cytobacillus firmus]MBU8773085.1 spore cortex biosynthesis protein YabQ [Cytobacillus oceanisediminis]MCM3246408.1 spore cortex biosynthesis protein YabQ [Cytobacillus oceanisediminis]MCM3405631.1 spore cortex biosynthesis protein YabQ [Cytobacillus oceanisediminis]MCM3532389.1 spore cortex biosynthesis protein YabQ [Cytobacillus oceanisediminis]